MENKINWKQKLTSRKLWFAIVGVVIGAAMAFGVEGGELKEIIALIAGAATAVGSVIGYIDGEADVDAARAKSGELAELLGMAAQNTDEIKAAEVEENLGNLELGGIEK